jgi:hypothetical protein
MFVPNKAILLCLGMNSLGVSHQTRWRPTLFSWCTIEKGRVNKVDIQVFWTAPLALGIDYIDPINRVID